MTDVDGRLLARALPTKEFFIHMLVRDIGLVPAIVDLVDNSVDGARRTRPEGNYSGLWVRIEADSTHLRIQDNCGGIDIKTAQDYAFRFGRDPNAPHRTHTIGQFGVGMKRALFKLGDEFEVESRTAVDHFRILVNLTSWTATPDLWDFPIDLLDDASGVLREPGVNVHVMHLNEAVAEALGQDLTITQLQTELSLVHQYALESGLQMAVNGFNVEPSTQVLLQSTELRPAVEEHDLQIGGSAVRCRVVAGVATSDPSSAGWYIYCNGRLVIRADQTNVTGWGEAGEATVPKYHNQFARFRGYVLFDSDDAGVLPWTTTKTGIDPGAAAYRVIRPRMLALMRSVITFLNELDAEERPSEADAESVVLDSLASVVKASQAAALVTFPASKFVAPKRVARPPTLGNILYQRPIEQIRRLQKALGATTYREVGERTFDHYLEYEIDS